VNRRRVHKSQLNNISFTLHEQAENITGGSVNRRTRSSFRATDFTGWQFWEKYIVTNGMPVQYLYGTVYGGDGKSIKPAYGKYGVKAMLDFVSNQQAFMQGFSVRHS
jgi:hypothetical protein